MNLNYTAFFLISFIPLLLGWLWYGQRSPISKYFGVQAQVNRKISLLKMIALFILSVGFVYGYINVIIHQMGFYELFFTDIMMGNQESQKVVDDFLSVYGDKHRHFGHGIFHGAINAFVLVLPIVAAFTLIEGKSFKFLAYHFSYWLVMSIVIGGLISAFV